MPAMGQGGDEHRNSSQAVAASPTRSLNDNGTSIKGAFTPTDVVPFIDLLLFQAFRVSNTASIPRGTAGLAQIVSNQRFTFGNSSSAMPCHS